MNLGAQHSRQVSTRLTPAIERARVLFRDLLIRLVPVAGASIDQYSRYLTMQFHLTREVQTYFLTASAHRDLARRRGLRRFLVDFANEEELHYLVAANDLAELGLMPGPIPVDVLLWHAYFGRIVAERPFVRLGAACILENISGGEARAETRRALSAPFLNRRNSKFLTLHQHETLPHGDQLLEALDRADLSEAHIRDLEFGASVGTVLYLRMAEWAIDPDALSTFADSPAPIEADEVSRIAQVAVGADQQVSLQPGV